MPKVNEKKKENEKLENTSIYEYTSAQYNAQ